MATSTLSSIHALRRPRRIDRRVVLGLFLSILAVLGSLIFWSASSATTGVLVVTHDLPAGSTLSAGDLAVAHVRVDSSIYQAAVPASELDAVAGKQLTAPIYAYQLLVRAQLSNSLPLHPDQMAFTIPVTPDTAAGGQIRPGDIVEVFVTSGKGSSSAQSTVVLPRVAVYDVGYGGGTTTINTTGSAVNGSSARGGDMSWLTLIVTQKQALQLARARWSGQLDVALRPGR